MSNTATLKFDIKSYWHAGTGRGSGHYLDAMNHTDINGIPCLPGKTVKGLLRDAVNRLESWENPKIPLGSCERLFGTIGFEEGRTRRETTPGALQFTDAKLPKEIVLWLSQKEQATHKKALFTELFSTAIEDSSGTAKTASLRGLQAVVPLELKSQISFRDDGSELAKEWMNIIKTALPLIRAIGSNRSRGFGRTVVTMEANS